MKAGELSDKYYGASGHDLRDGKEFKDFKKEVLKFIRAKKSVTWRQLNEAFYYNAYWLTLAVEMLDGKHITVEAHKTPERIVAKTRKNQSIN